MKANPLRQSVLIVQPYVPKYRVAFFSSLIQMLEGEGVACRVAAAPPPRGQSERGDAVTADWIVNYAPRTVRISGRTIGLGGARPLWKNDSAVIVGHLGSALDTYSAIYDGMRKRLKVGLWGHIKPYVNDGNPIDLALERWQLGKCHRVFAYTPGGRDYALAAGVEAANVTTVMNATDTSLLQQARQALSPASVHSFMTAHSLVPGRTLGYIGGLDSSKRIDFLAAVLDSIWVSDPDIKVIVGGRGSDAHLLDVARSRGQVVMLGYASVEDQALIARVSSALVMPGRIGLVAVDALVLGIPILTTDWPYHAPEHEYLVESKTRFTSADNIQSYTSLIRHFLEDQVNSPDQGSADWRYPSINSMVDNFGSGVLQLLGRR